MTLGYQNWPQRGPGGKLRGATNSIPNPNYKRSLEKGIDQAQTKEMEKLG